jgi:hypothetical protein
LSCQSDIGKERGEGAKREKRKVQVEERKGEKESG